MKIAVLTSSRADFGIYLPLLRAMEADPEIDMSLLVFGTHASRMHGYTLQQIRETGFRIDQVVESILTSDSEAAIATAMGLTQIKFAQIWEQYKNNYALVICLGDRFEMFAAVAAGIPFGIDFAHFHGGETTLGAIDNEFRHCLSLFSKLHFAATDAYKAKIIQLTGSTENVFNIGSLSLENITQTPLFSKGDFHEKFGIDLDKDTLLVTFHPETRQPEKNIAQAESLCEALTAIGMQTVITMPNADTSGTNMREVYQRYAKKNPLFILIDNFGSQGYFSCLHYARLVIGNSSSGIIEAASFGKYVINIGRRQEGRAVSPNVFHTAASAEEIKKTALLLLQSGDYTGPNIYYQPQPSKHALDLIKTYLRNKESRNQVVSI